MENQTFSATAVAAALLWLGALAVVLVQVSMDMDVAPLGILLAVGAATLTVRYFFVRTHPSR